MLDDLLQRRPIIVVLAGPNGAGKSTFFNAHLTTAGLRFVNADLLAREFALDPQQAMAAADALRIELIRQGESFVTKTVFSDPVGAKLSLLTQAMGQGYTVVLVYIGVSGPERCDERVAMRVSQGGHDVPADRLVARYPRTLANLQAALPLLSAVLVYDNDDLLKPYRLVAKAVGGKVELMVTEVPAWWPRSP